MIQKNRIQQFVLLSALLFSGCVSTKSEYFSESFIRDGKLSAKGSSFVGFSLDFDAIPQDLDWSVAMKVRNVTLDKVVTLTATGQELAVGKSGDVTPVVFSVPTGKYTLESLELEFPKDKNDLYRTKQQKIVVKTSTPIPPAEVTPGWMLFVGNVEITHDDFLIGKDSHATNVTATWDPEAPAMGTTWQQIRGFVGVTGVGNYLVSDSSKKGIVPALLMYEKTTEAAFAALKSGFSDSYGLVVVRANDPGFAFFEDTAGNLMRVESKQIGKSQYYGVAVDSGEHVSLRGFCFQAEKTEGSCMTEKFREKPLFTRGEFNPGGIRYRGTFTRNAAMLTMSPALDETVALDLSKEMPGTTLRSYVLADEPLKRNSLGFTLFDEKAVRVKWDAASESFVHKITVKARECDNKLRSADPFVTASWEMFFEPNSVGKLVLKPDSVKGVGEEASDILQKCLLPEVSSWTMLEKSEIGKGFGVRFR